MPWPFNDKELQCFLGMADFLKKFFPKLDEHGHSLRNVMTKIYFMATRAYKQFQWPEGTNQRHPILEILQSSLVTWLQINAN